MSNELIETEKIIASLTNDETVEIDDEQKALIDKFLHAEITDEDVESSLEEAEQQNSSKKPKTKAKKSMSQLADEYVGAFLTVRSDKNWKKVQEFFWYGIKQFAYKYVKNSDDAYDMTIETFMTAYQKMDMYDPDKSKFSTWLWTICRNICLGYLKNKARLSIVDNDISEVFDSKLAPSALSQDSMLLDSGKVVGGKVIIDEQFDVTKELCDVSIKEMKNIGGICEQILRMKLVDDKKIREIADIMNMNESTVKNYLYNGKRNLKKILEVNHRDLVDAFYDSKTYSDNQIY